MAFKLRFHITVDTIMCTSPVNIHLITRNEPEIDFLMFPEN